MKRDVAKAINRGLTRTGGEQYAAFEDAAKLLTTLPAGNGNTSHIQLIRATSYAQIGSTVAEYVPSWRLHPEEWDELYRLCRETNVRQSLFNTVHTCACASGSAIAISDWFGDWDTNGTLESTIAEWPVHIRILTFEISWLADSADELITSISQLIESGQGAQNIARAWSGQWLLSLAELSAAAVDVVSETGHTLATLP